MRKNHIFVVLLIFFINLDCFAEIPESKFKNKSLLEIPNYPFHFMPDDYFPDNLTKNVIHDFALMLNCKADLNVIRRTYEKGSYITFWLKDYSIQDQFERYVENLYWKSGIYIDNELKEWKTFNYEFLPQKAKELLEKYKGTSLETILTVNGNSVSFIATQKIDPVNLITMEMKYSDLKERVKNKEQFQTMIEPRITYYTLHSCYPEA